MIDKLFEEAKNRAVKYSSKTKDNDPELAFALGFIAGYKYNTELTRQLLPERTITRKQAEAQHFVEMHWKWFDKPPTYRAVAKAFDIAPSAAFARLKYYRHRMKTR